jgi:molybdate transport system permease protein
MDWIPLYNSLRVAGISTFITFFAGIFAARYIAKTPRIVKGVLDCVLTLPLVLPPTVVGFFLLKLIGPLGPVGSRVLALWGFRLTMAWYSAVFATTVVAFPLMYRTARGAFEAFDVTLLYSGQTLGLSNAFLFWRVILPNCKQGILAGTVLSFARALGEYGATTMVTGYIPGRTAMISTTVYQLWREGNDALAYKWVRINLIISFFVLVSVNMLENRYTRPQRKPSAPAVTAPH